MISNHLHKCCDCDRDELSCDSRETRDRSVLASVWLTWMAKARISTRMSQIRHRFYHNYDDDYGKQKLFRKTFLHNLIMLPYQHVRLVTMVTVTDVCILLVCMFRLCLNFIFQNLWKIRDSFVSIYLLRYIQVTESKMSTKTSDAKKIKTRWVVSVTIWRAELMYGNIASPSFNFWLEKSCLKKIKDE